MPPESERQGASGLETEIIEMAAELFKIEAKLQQAQAKVTRLTAELAEKKPQLEALRRRLTQNVGERCGDENLPCW